MTLTPRQQRRRQQWATRTETPHPPFSAHHRCKRLAYYGQTPDEVRATIARSGLSLRDWARNVAHVNDRTVRNWVMSDADKQHLKADGTPKRRYQRAAVRHNRLYVPNYPAMKRVVEHRIALLHELAPMLMRAGALHPDRLGVNRMRQKECKRIRAQIRTCERWFAVDMTALILNLPRPPIPEFVP